MIVLVLKHCEKKNDERRKKKKTMQRINKIESNEWCIQCLQVWKFSNIVYFFKIHFLKVSELLRNK